RARTGRLLSPGVSVENQASTGTTVSYLLGLGAGQYVHIAVEPQGVPIVATLLDPARGLVADARDPEGGDAPLQVLAIADRSGVHELNLVLSGPPRRSGRYRLTMDRPR